ncbi:DNA internalization-related competence protein ComEC/Rec2 [Desulfosoma caldarium]|uniref:Competence protein ComEC n=1 Tax=Desulfosoma caldarium TaxID=610254 RepID=A0A3N1UR08_9BACT|nr:DNA internalization-related competence protein ComEC/Rec2 [Desulfosoma caldarium]ROQ93545.1 competence protein ComEC [Desulfosoma caldarium]
MSSRRVLGSRPLGPLAVAFALGIACAHHRGLDAAVPGLGTAASLAALGLGAAIGSRRSRILLRRVAAVLLCLAAASLGASLWARAEKKAVPPSSLASLLDGTERRYRVVLQPFPDVYPDKTIFPVTLMAVAENTEADPAAPLPENGFFTSLDARTNLFTTSFAGKPSVGVRVSVRRLLRAWKAGDVVEMPLKLRPLTNFENPGRHDYMAEMARRGFFAYASTKSDIFWVRVPDNRVRGAGHDGVFGRMDALRGHLRRIVTKNLTEPEAALAQALFLGYRRAMPRPMQDDFQKAGAAHLLAVSGLHVGLAAWAVFRLAQLFLRFLCPHVLLRIPDVHLAWWIGCAAAAVYAVLAGLAVPTQRALIMLATATVAFALYRRPDALSLLSAASLLILWNDPNHLFRPSFQLSFAAVVGLALFYPSWRDRAQKLVTHLPRRLRALWRLFFDAFLASAAATLVVAPLTAYHFHSISLAGFAANTILVPFMALAVLPPGLAALGLSALLPFAAAWILLPIQWALRVLIWLIQIFAALPYAFAHVGPVPLAALVAVYAVFALWALSMPWSRKIWGTAALAALWALSTVLRPALFPSDGQRPFRITALDVGQGSATVVECPPDAAMLVDGGGFYNDSFDVGRYVVAPALWAMGIRRLDAVVLSHDHPDHRNGLRFILDTFPVGRYVETGLTARGLTGSVLSAVAARRGIPIVHTLSKGRKCLNGTVDLGTLGACRLRALHPTSSFVHRSWNGKDLNEASLVLAVTHEKAGALLPGDIGQDTEESLLSRWNFEGRHWVLVASHHGSATSTGERLLETLNPQAVLISCGAGNPFGFPAPAVLQRLKDRRLAAFRTDLHGAVHVIWNNGRWTVTPTLSARPRLYSPGSGP